MKLYANAPAGTYALSLRKALPAAASDAIRVLNVLELRQTDDDVLLELLDALGPLDPAHLCRMIKSGWLHRTPGFGKFTWAGLSLYAHVPAGALRISLVTNDIMGVLYTNENAQDAFDEPFSAGAFLSLMEDVSGAARPLLGQKIMVALAVVVGECQATQTRMKSNDDVLSRVKSLIDATASGDVT